MNFFLDKLTTKPLTLLLFAGIAIIFCFIYSYYALRVPPPPTTTNTAQSSIISAAPSVAYTPAQVSPLSSADDLAKKSLLMQTLHTDNQSGVVYKSPSVQIEYVAADDLFQVEILTTDIPAAKKEAEKWFLLQGISQKGICSLQIFFYLNVVVKDNVPGGAQVSPLPDGC